MSSSAKGGLQTGILRRAWDAAVDFLLRKEVVGYDKMGNKYFRYFETKQGSTVERREVKWNTLYIMYDPKDIPPEWRMWLRKLRDQPPTEAELEQSEAKARTMQTRVAALEEQERLRRLRMQAMGGHAHQTSQPPDMSQLLQQMGRSEDGSRPAGPAPNSNGPQPGQGASTPEQGSGDTFAPGVWKPGK